MKRSLLAMGLALFSTLAAATAIGCSDDSQTGTLIGASTKSKKSVTDAAPPAEGDEAGDPSTDGTDPNAPPASDPGTNGNAGGGGTVNPGSGSGSAACLPAVQITDNGHHHPGQDCLGCHQALPGFAWTVAGTLFDPSGSSPVGGAVVEMVDAQGTHIALRTAQNGNFYTDQPLAFPLRVRATQCPSSQVMQSPVQAGSCNAAGCHGGASRLHL